MGPSGEEANDEEEEEEEEDDMYIKVLQDYLEPPGCGKSDPFDSQFSLCVHLH